MGTFGDLPWAPSRLLVDGVMELQGAEMHP